MDIFISSAGKEIGPLSEETAQTLVKQGSVTATDLAWRPGMEDWAPLCEILPLKNESDLPDPSDLSDPSDEPPAESAPSPPTGDAPTEAHPQIEPATAKQKAFLEYLAIGFPDDLSKGQASTLLDDAMEDTAFAERIGKWSAERLRLHPNLFAAEIHARKENRANYFFEVCQTEGAQFFTRITKAHCHVLVSFLDIKFPTWDSRMEDAATNYFFPAVAEKFPQFVERQWNGHFHYAEGAESVRKSPTTRIGKRSITPLEAVGRGLVIGVAILGALYFAQRTIPRGMDRPSPEKASLGDPSPPPYQPPSVASVERAKPPEPSAPDSSASKKKNDKTARKETAIENNAPTDRK